MTNLNLIPTRPIINQLLHQDISRTKELASFKEKSIDSSKYSSKHAFLDDSKKHIPISAIEKWLTTTLEDAAYFNIPNVILKPENIKILQRYKIDRFSLGKHGLSTPIIDRLYRSLFVYSTGFHEVIKTTMKHTDNSYAVAVDIWKTFSILLETSCQADYQMVVQSLLERQNMENEEFKKEIAEQNKDVTEQNEQLKQKLSS